MKKMIAVLLAALLLPFVLVGAEGSPGLPPPLGVDYLGTWTEVDLGFQLYLPNEWVLFVDEADFTAGNEQATRYFWVEAHDSGGYSLDDVALEFSQLYEDAQIVIGEAAAFVTFRAPKTDIFCGVTLSPDELQLFFFKFVPLKDADFVLLAGQILSTYRLLD